ncbi:MAG: hypothetical protein ACOX05_04135 [Bacillota bacterium]|jgi:DNA-directed RNA polymerase subunit RPC12/RpoP
MTEYRCGDCEKGFDEPIEWREDHGEELWGCPYCGGAATKWEEGSHEDDDS